ncbi:MAG: ASKHA domain-containing protein [Candidatus Hydrogenedentes bacterium]|nr:ASKHA domain-containing protein [Candidatus Hydrogenedentota bacterium]
MTQSIEVTFSPQGKRLQVSPGATVREAAARAGIQLDYPCGGQGTCGKCRVRFTEGAMEPTETDSIVLPPADVESGVRLACQTRIYQRAAIEIPQTSLLGSAYKILGESSFHAIESEDPPILKICVELPPPSLEDDSPDFPRINRAHGPLAVDLSTLRRLPKRLREGGFKGTLVLADGRLLDFEPGDTTTASFAVAFDIGTTTLVGTLLDLNSGAMIAQTSRMNPQIQHGDDVVSRILHVRQHVYGLSELHAHVVAALNEMIAELVSIGGIDVHSVYHATFAGNTTMQHLLAGLDPTALGELPFTPTVSAGLLVRASELGIVIHPAADAYVFPVIGGFVGGDTVAGLLATGIFQTGITSMLVDIGTNGELVLCHKGHMLGASCAAGPAFEGAKIAHGMRATTGAIEEIIFADDVYCRVIGDTRPVGMCGSAMIDLVAELLRAGILISQGQLLGPDHLPDDIPPALRARVTMDSEGAVFVVARADETASGHAITFTQRDVREVQLATAAIRTAFSILLKKANLEPDDVDQVLVAGAFGNYLRCANAQRMGLLPNTVPPSKLTFVRNTSLAGARLAAMSRSARHEAERLARHTNHVELSLDPSFHAEYVEAMFFPDTEPTETPI